ncbi:uncharacterized protein LOC115884557 [Sitophilus oryzae]|uniref:Uncharacterized protein LOC115884557 n=1 Tax=Sitophilus oryzae TaxID=7048 RepID=A0A6J2Y7U4_SITOR|nr:uncharacterized protein LOC115884557 [Sitophilus oryzae]
MDEEDWAEKLIQTIESKPALYNRAMREHSDRNTIKQLWNEVCEVMVENWNVLLPAEKTAKGNEIQQRWRNMRTCFKRELNKQKNSDCGQKFKRRKYIYFNKLLFLLPSIEDRSVVNDINSPGSSVKEEYKTTSDSEEDVSVQHLYPITTFNQPPQKSYEESLLSILNDKKTEDIDEDKLFLLSLVPSFKKFTDDEKLEAKMEFLKVIRRITQSHQDSASSYPTNSCNDVKLE